MTDFEKVKFYYSVFDERQRCASEVERILEPNGFLFASFIPYMSGAVGVVDRALYFADQVNCDNLSMVFGNGIFCDNANRGFQGGYYPTSAEI